MRSKAILPAMLFVIITAFSMQAKVVSVNATASSYIPPATNAENMTLYGWNADYGDEQVNHNLGGYICCKSTSIDPQVQLRGLLENLSSTQNYIIFDYKSDTESTGEFFFCPSGGVAAAGRSQTFTLPVATEWTTLVIDISASRTNFSWGSTGDFIRFDPTKTSGVTQSFRRIRVISTTDALPVVYGNSVILTKPDGTVYLGTANELVAYSKYLREKYTVNGSGITNNIFLTADIDMKNRTDYIPIGYSAGSSIRTPYMGTFDGQGHEISNFYVSTESEGGLIGRLSGGTIQNVGINGATVKTTGERAGVIAGEAVSGSTIKNCYSFGKISVEGGTNDQAGGIVGEAYSVTLTNCYTSHPVLSSSYGDGTVDNCYYVGDSNGTTAETIASGETCWMLNGGSFGSTVYFQTLGTDDHPVLKSSHNTVVVSCGDFTNYTAPKSDTWVCCDGLGRTVASSDEGVTRSSVDEDCVVGMFYYVWHGQHGTEIKDITRILEANPDNPTFGAENQFHWGGKPAMGYYTGGDKFIIAHHMQQLVDAGVDFYFIDVTNAFTYNGQMQVVFDEIDRRISLGLKYPKIAFCCHSSSASVSLSLYNKWYTDPANDHYWFYWNGKPLMLIDSDVISSLDINVRNNFTLRGSWAWQEGEDEWPWLAFYPQKLNYSNEMGTTVYEQMTVSAAMHAYSKIGKSYSGGAEPAIDKYGLTTKTSQGLFFEEQFGRAISQHPKVLMITQWNEWMAQRFITTSSTAGYTRPGATQKAGESYFVDVYNQEFSRDIEPSSESLIRDNYYMQLVSNVRKYRGVNDIPVPKECKSIDINGGFGQWAGITTEFTDEPGDCEYTSSSAQNSASLQRSTNDIVICKVTKDLDNLYFYVQINGSSFVDPSSSAGESWMTLLLNSDTVYSNGWEGYDYMLSRDGDNYYLYYWDSALSSWVQDKQLQWAMEGNELMLSVARTDVNLSGDADFDFKWVDNTPAQTAEILDFLCNGDAAPNARFNYRYKGSQIKATTGISEVRTSANEKSDAKYDLQGRRIQEPQKGHIYLMEGNKFIGK